MAMGIVERINEKRGQFCLRCDDGSYRYFRCLPQELPREGDTLSCPEDRPADRRFCLVDVTDNNRHVHAFSSVYHLSRDIALRLVDGDDLVSP
jgi:hypothetical protein